MPMILHGRVRRLPVLRHLAAAKVLTPRRAFGQILDEAREQMPEKDRLLAARIDRLIDRMRQTG